MQGRRTSGEVRHWSQREERGSDLGLRLLVGITRRFGRALALPGVHLAVIYFWIADGLGARVSRRYLERLHRHLCGRGESPGFRPGWIASYRHYLEFALTIVDRMVLWGGNTGAFEFAMEVEDPAFFQRHQAQGQGGIVLGAHLGCFDALRILSERDGVKVHVLMYTRHAPIVNTIFRELSPDVDVRVIEPSGSTAGLALEIRSLVERGEWVGILGDRIEPGDHGKAGVVDFLGAPARFPLAPHRLALQLGCPMVSLFALRDGAWRYRVRSRLLTDGKDKPPRALRDARARELLERYVRVLEDYCAEAPSQWYNFFDFWTGEGTQ